MVAAARQQHLARAGIVVGHCAGGSERARKSRRLLEIVMIADICIAVYLVLCLIAAFGFAVAVEDPIE